MNDTRRRLDLLLEDLPEHVSVDAGAAWRQGVRRRVRRRVALAVSVVLVVAMAGLAAALGVLPGHRLAGLQPAGTEPPHVSGYPTRLDHPWLPGVLPQRPGPLAGLVSLESGEVLAASAGGHLWRLPGGRTADGFFYPTLSPDGSRLGYLAAGADGVGTLVIRDVVTGRETRFPSIGTAAIDNATGLTRDLYYVGLQQPSSWSPDGRTVLVSGGGRARSSVTRALLLGVDGSLRALDEPVPEAAQPVGWLGDGSLVWVARRDGYLVEVVTDLHSEVERTRRLTKFTRGVSQWTAALSPDGRRMAVLRNDDRPGKSETTYDLEDARPVATTREIGAAGRCALSWRGGLPLFPADSGVDDTVVLRDSTGGVVIAASPRLGVKCSTWAADALAGQPHGGPVGWLFGTSTAAWTWWWREGLAGIVLALGVVGLVVRRSRRRSR